MIPKMSFIISWLGKLSGNCNLLVEMGEDTKCCGETNFHGVTGSRKTIGG